VLKRWHLLIALALLAVVAYLPTLRQPLLEDDYPNIAEAHALGLHILSDPIFGIRSSFFLLIDGLYRLFGMTAAAYYIPLIVLHVFNTWLVYALGYWRPVGYRVSAWAAAFFAVYEGHQEGIMWVSGATEPLLFLFGVGAFLCWLRFLYEGKWAWYAAALVAFVPALYSKESAFICVALMLLPAAFDRSTWRRAVWIIPFGLLAGASVAHVLYTRTYSFRFNDGSFSLHAPFWLTWPNTLVRLFWIWGLLALAAVAIWKPARWMVVTGIGLLWAGLSLVPYSFLTYATRIPSRQVYLASAGLALVVGLALMELYSRYWRRWPVLVAVVCAVILLQNVVYLWTKKRGQFLERAAPTEQLIALSRRTQGPIFVECFPRPPLVADWAVRLTTGHELIWDAAKRGSAAATFCYAVRGKSQ
jgi:hypothetical protein